MKKKIISERGQVTIPKTIRRRFGLLPGTSVEFVVADGEIRLVKSSEQDPVSEWRGRGSLPIGDDTDSYLSRIRDENGD